MYSSPSTRGSTFHRTINYVSSSGFYEHVYFNQSRNYGSVLFHFKDKLLLKDLPAPR